VPQLSRSQAAAIAAGQVVTLPHRYVASSSGDVTFSVTTLSETPANGYSVALYRDPDCDGAPDTPLTAAVPVSVGEVICLVARVAAGGGVGPSGSFAFRLEADTSFTDTSATNQLVNVDRLGAATASGLILRKTVRNLTQNTAEDTANSGSPGDVLAYRIHVVNATTEPVDDIEIFDRTPPYTELDSAPTSPTALSGGVSCAVVEPATPAAGYSGHLRWTCSGALDPGAEGSVIFEVRIGD